MLLLTLGLASASLLAASPVRAETTPAGFSVEILIDGQPVREYPARGTRYIEALKNTEYAIRLRNPLGVRVAVALSVDGLNTIDAKRTSAVNARKWVLAPYETVVISGWQTSSSHARQFYFTSEEQSYAQRLGQASDLGVISAVFYRERLPEPLPVTAPRATDNRTDAAGEGRTRQPSAGAPAAAPSEAQKSEAGAAGSAAAREEYAATGIGRRTEHQVEQVYLDLEPRAVASVNLRYEYRQQLVRLGVLPAAPDTLTRRERARGFEPGWCPAPR